MGALQGLEGERDRVAERSRAIIEEQKDQDGITANNCLYASRSALDVDSTEVGDGEPICDTKYAAMLTQAYLQFNQLPDSELSLKSTCQGLYRGFEWCRDMSGIGNMAKAFLSRPDWKENLIHWCDDSSSGAGGSLIKAYTSEGTPFYKVCTELTCKNKKGRITDA